MIRNMLIAAGVAGLLVLSVACESATQPEQTFREGIQRAPNTVLAQPQKEVNATVADLVSHLTVKAYEHDRKALELALAMEIAAEGTPDLAKAQEYSAEVLATARESWEKVELANQLTN